jgi:hypothetical protein
MARVRLGGLRDNVMLIDRDQLPPAEVVQGRVPLLALHHNARLFPLPHLASDRRAQHLRVPFCEGSLYVDMYVSRIKPLYHHSLTGDR